MDFDSLDGKPTHLLFVLGLKYEELEFPWLSKLVQMLAQPNAVRSLLAAPDVAAIHAALTDAERRLEPAVAVGT